MQGFPQVGMRAIAPCTHVICAPYFFTINTFPEYSHWKSSQYCPLLLPMHPLLQNLRTTLFFTQTSPLLLSPFVFHGRVVHRQLGKSEAYGKISNRRAQPSSGCLTNSGMQCSRFGRKKGIFSRTAEKTCPKPIISRFFPLFAVQNQGVFFSA